MKIYRQQTEIYDIRPEDNSTQRVVHMGENVLNLTFKTTSALDLRINDYVVFENTTYKFKTLCNPTRRSRHEFEYTCQLFSPQYDLQDVLFIFEDKTGVGILDETVHICETADIHLQQIVKCIKAVHPEWTVGDIEQTSEAKTITYTEMNCLEALQHMAEEFNLEYWITGTSISLGKKKYGDPIVFKYGKGDALYELSRQNQDGRIVTALRVRGSDRNIDSSEYGCKYLHLPNNEHYVYQNVDKYGMIQDRMSFPDIYPRLIHKNSGDPGAITSVRQDEKGIWYVKDDNINKVFPDLNIELLDSQVLAVHFQTGHLGGLKIDANWHQDTGEYELLEGDYGLGQDIPSSPAFVPSVGDLYLLSNLKMPKAYFDMAEQELYEAGVEAIKQLCEQKVSYKGPVNPLFFRLIGETIETGRAVVVEDDAIVDGAGSVELRMQAYTRSINDDLSLDIEISDTLYVSRINKIENTIQENKNDAEQKINYGDAYTKRRFRDAKETMTLLENAQLNFSESINPVAVQTMQLLVGDESLQFRFVNGRTNPVEVDDTMNYNNSTRMFHAGKANEKEIIQHMTLGINTMSPTHTPSPDKKYKFWDIEHKAELIPDSEARYIYLKCSKTNELDGKYVLSKTSIKMEEVAGYYHFLAAILNSEYEGSRSFVPMYGFTEITPGQMRVGKIINTDGTQYWDMINKKFKIGDSNSYVSWNVDKANQLVIKGTILQSGTEVQNPDGETDYIGIDRGNWVANTTYYPGDMVKYSDGSIYKCKAKNTGILPTNAAYWKLQISAGADGNTKKSMYRRSATQVAAPTASTMSYWYDSPPTGTDPLWMSEATFNSAGTNISGWSYPVRITGDEGRGYMYAYFPSDNLSAPTSGPSTPGLITGNWIAEPNFSGKRFIYYSQCVKENGTWKSWSTPLMYARLPEDGDPGPGIVFRGSWHDDAVKYSRMYNNAARRDVVVANWGSGNVYYIYKGTDGAYPSVPFLDWNGKEGAEKKGDWAPFGANFSSVATDLLFTPNGNVGGWIFKNQQMESQEGGAYLNGKNGSIKLGNGNFTVDESGNVNIAGKFESNKSGNRIVIDPSDRSIKMTNNSGLMICTLSFKEMGSGAILPNFRMNEYVGGTLTSYTEIDGASISLRTGSGTLFFGADLYQKKIHLNYNMLRPKDQCHPFELYTDGETLKVYKG